ncbi:hypothetical protein BYT27DRAFT_7246059 [Phlegmacium glaucopus]|nr:hypothetical protein BYT27DRAFT_7246059 [Phlegmacium glaucopus]
MLPSHIESFGDELKLLKGNSWSRSGHGLMVSKCLSSEETTRLDPPGFDECKKRPIANVVQVVDHLDATYHRQDYRKPLHLVVGRPRDNSEVSSFRGVINK